jgi:hypothetical protein
MNIPLIVFVIVPNICSARARIGGIFFQLSALSQTAPFPGWRSSIPPE